MFRIAKDELGETSLELATRNGDGVARTRSKGAGGADLKGYEYLDDQLGNLKGNVKINKYESAESVNQWWAKKWI